MFKKITLHPLFLLYVIYLILTKQMQSVLFFCVALVLHELSHYFVAKKLGYKLKKLKFMPYGVCLNYKNSYFDSSDEFKIAVAGPLCNLLVCVLLGCFWWIFPVFYNYSIIFFYCNLSLALFNLLPFFPLDGGRMVSGILCKKYARKTVVKTLVILNIVFSSFLIVLFFVSLVFDVVNFNVLIIAFFLIVSVLEPKQNNSYDIFTSSQTVQNKNNIKDIKFLYVSCDEYIFKVLSKMDKFKFNVLYIQISKFKTKVVNEFVFKQIALKYSSSAKLCDVYELFV